MQVRNYATDGAPEADACCRAHIALHSQVRQVATQAKLGTLRPAKTGTSKERVLNTCSSEPGEVSHLLNTCSSGPGDAAGR